MEKIINKNRYEIEEIIEKYSNYVLSVIRTTTRILSDEDMEEITADVFLAVWHNMDKIDRQKDIKPYLAGITRNLIKNKYRKLHIEMDIEEYEVADVSDIQKLIEEQEKNELIKSALDNMEEKDRKIFILFYYYSKNIEEIAKEMNITKSNAKTKLSRIRKKIKRILEEGGYSYGE